LSARQSCVRVIMYHWSETLSNARTLKRHYLQLTRVRGKRRSGVRRSICG